MVLPKSIFSELERNAEPTNGVRGLRMVEERGHDPLVVLRDGGASVRDRRIGCRKSAAAAVVAHQTFEEDDHVRVNLADVCFNIHQV
jgi:hypothetical protein